LYDATLEQGIKEQIRQLTLVGLVAKPKNRLLVGEIIENRSNFRSF
jgi:hypothetical protein